MPIERTFQDIPEGKFDEADQHAFLVGLGWREGLAWDDLLNSKRILIVSEAGAGKTYECEEQQRRMWEDGEPAFRLELASLAVEKISDLLSGEEEERFDAWLLSQVGIATFFLDSIDELKLTSGSFRRALTRFAKSLSGQLGRVRIVLTTRPIPFDKNLAQTILQIPKDFESGESQDCQSFVDIATGTNVGSPQVKDQEEAPDWREVALIPLSDQQILAFASGRGVDEPELLLKDLRSRNALDFVRRPQDLIELCSDWIQLKRIRSHYEQVGSNITIKLKPSDERGEIAELSLAKATEGASRLALAMMMTRRLTIRHSAEADRHGQEGALDPEIILADWSKKEIQALLERPLFGFASYGRVRFHHRSVLEYLAARRLLELRRKGMSKSALRRLITADTRGTTVVRPSKRAIAGWLALEDEFVFGLLRDNEPEVLLCEGDPQSLSLVQRQQALRCFVQKHGSGGWRGIRVPYVQVHRFSSADLSSEINNLWDQGIENPEIRETLLRLVEMGPIAESSDIAYETSQNLEASKYERIASLNALVGVDDFRLKKVAEQVSTNEKVWTEDLAKEVTIILFPKYLDVSQLCNVLERVECKKSQTDHITWELNSLLRDSELNSPTLRSLRDGLVVLVEESLRWQETCPHCVSDRPHLSEALAVVCARGLKREISDKWLLASILAMRIPHRDYAGEHELEVLSEELTSLSAEDNARLFWLEYEFLKKLGKFDSPKSLYLEITYMGASSLSREKDWSWVESGLKDVELPIERRAMLLEAAIRLPPSSEEWGENFKNVRELVKHQKEFEGRIAEIVKSNKDVKKHRQREKKFQDLEEKKRREEAAIREGWVRLWQSIIDTPENAFSEERVLNTVWDLWRTMRRSLGNRNGDKFAGWNRLFLESHFGKDIADQVRRKLMELWRQDMPTVSSERPEGEENTYLLRWRLGLAGIYAEAEDDSWAEHLTVEEGERAARYALVGFDTLPHWILSVIESQPETVLAIIGNELRLSFEIVDKESSYFSLLGYIERADERVALFFLPIVASSLHAILNHEGEHQGQVSRTRQIVAFLLKHGGEEQKNRLLIEAESRFVLTKPGLFDEMWLSLLLREKRELGMRLLVSRLDLFEPSASGGAVDLLANVFAQDGYAAKLPDFRTEPLVLFQLMKLFYQYVRPEDDVTHEGAYSPNNRDNAQMVRHHIVQFLLELSGEEGWEVKRLMAKEPNCSHFKDRIAAIAKEKWAEEVDGQAFTDELAVQLDQTSEPTPFNNEMMFTLMVDRLEDLSDLLLEAESPWEVWGAIEEEKILRREVARELKNRRNGLYTVDMEAVTADEKETDIRLRSTASHNEAIIELKLGNKLSATELKTALREQLVSKYLAPKDTRSGCLLFAISRSRSWLNPDTKERMNLSGLVEYLQADAATIEEEMGGELRLHVHALDLTPRLQTEAIK